MGGAAVILGISLTTEVAGDENQLAALVEDLLEIVVRQNVAYFETHPNAPCCLDCGTVKYREPSFASRVTFATAEDILRTGYAGCAGAAAYMAAKNRTNGIDSKVVLQRTGARDFHAIVQRPDGSTYDPTLSMPV